MGLNVVGGVMGLNVVGGVSGIKCSVQGLGRFLGASKNQSGLGASSSPPEDLASNLTNLTPMQTCSCSHFLGVIMSMHYHQLILLISLIIKFHFFWGGWGRGWGKVPLSLLCMEPFMLLIRSVGSVRSISRSVGSISRSIRSVWSIGSVWSVVDFLL